MEFGNESFSHIVIKWRIYCIKLKTTFGLKKRLFKCYRNWTRSFRIFTCGFVVFYNNWLSKNQCRSTKKNYVLRLSSTWRLLRRKAECADLFEGGKCTKRSWTSAKKSRAHRLFGMLPSTPPSTSICCCTRRRSVWSKWSYLLMRSSSGK